MRIIVIGATGTIGGGVVKALALNKRFALASPCTMFD